MKTFLAKVVVKLKPSITDVRGLTLKRSIEKLFPVKNLICRVGTSYSFEFDANNQVEAINLIEKIAQDLLYNEVTEYFEVRSLHEI